MMKAIGCSYGKLNSILQIVRCNFSPTSDSCLKPIWWKITLFSWSKIDSVVVAWTLLTVTYASMAIKVNVI